MVSGGLKEIISPQRGIHLRARYSLMTLVSGYHFGKLSLDHGPKTSLHRLYTLWFNFIFGLNFISFCFRVWQYMMMSLKQWVMKFKPRIKLNHMMGWTNECTDRRFFHNKNFLNV